MSRRWILSLLLATTVFGAVFASAASLGGINTGNLGADDQAITSCDTNGVATTYTTAYNTTGSAGYKVGNLTVSGISDACDGQSIAVTLVGTANASLQEVTGTVPTAAGANTHVLNFAGTTLAESVLGVHVVINGTATATN
jgi:hypothetical protein